MTTQTLDSRIIWDKRYITYGSRASSRAYQPWLDNLLLDKIDCGTRVLDLGCGEGRDAHYLCEQGYQVVAVDYSWEALQVARRVAPHARLAHVDFRDGLPFASNRFHAIISHLTLHYFSCQQTQAIVDELRDLLVPGGIFCARLNSTNDVNYGASGHGGAESEYVLRDGIYKRFYTQQRVENLFQLGWKIHSLAEKTVQRYHRPKVVWEVSGEKVALS